MNFPVFMFVHNIDPTIANFGFFELRWYGVIYAISFIIGYFMVKHLVKQKGIRLSEDDISDLLLYQIIGIVVGSRLGSVLSNLPYYAHNPLEIFAVWHGGMAFHGGLIGALIAGYFFARKKKVDILELADIVVIPVTLGLALGRIGNFINGEFYGTVTSLPWGVTFQNVEGVRHPVQLYESAKNIFIFSILWFLKDKNLKKGTLFWTFILLYGLLRFIIEFYKDLPLFMFNLTWGQVWCVPMVVVGAVMLFRLKQTSLLRGIKYINGKCYKFCKTKKGDEKW